MRSSGSALAVLVAGAAALASPAALPAQGTRTVAAHVEAFNATCRRGFPDLDAVARLAVQNGWQETSLRPAGPVPPQLAGGLPRVFHKDGMTLFLTTPQGGKYKRLCQLAGGEAGKATGPDVVAALAPSIAGYEPRAEKDRSRDGAVWAFSNKIEIEAGLVRGGRQWTISLVAREKP